MTLWFPLALLALTAAPLTVRDPLGTLHGFPSMSDVSGSVIADGELTQRVSGPHVVVRIRWRFADGRTAVEEDRFRSGKDLVQELFSWTETQDGEELRRFEVDFTTGEAVAVTRDEHGK